LAKGRKSKKVVRQLICDCNFTSDRGTVRIGQDCQCYQDGVGKFKALTTFIHKV
jgi:hypothetical protein